MEDIKNFKNKYIKDYKFFEKCLFGSRLYFEKCSENYFNFLASYFVVEGGVLTNEFRFVNVRRVS